ncbi:hypothetical protein RR46_08434 [Papilio xuthus]|uniref:Uncharacterized protein n=1 Tax=Papilio xuthus TaxID=66420 RepID=A0A194PG54_PAPXU|nr:hypothetical protein RR46_08434 [Papilio xuthus]
MAARTTRLSPPGIHLEMLAKRRNATSDHQPALHLVRSAQAVEPTVQVNPLQGFNFNVGEGQQTMVNSQPK